MGAIFPVRKVDEIQNKPNFGVGVNQEWMRSFISKVLKRVISVNISYQSCFFLSIYTKKTPQPISQIRTLRLLHKSINNVLYISFLGTFCPHKTLTSSGGGKSAQNPPSKQIPQVVESSPQRRVHPCLTICFKARYNR